MNNLKVNDMVDIRKTKSTNKHQFYSFTQMGQIPPVRSYFQSDVDAIGGWNVVVFHSDHDFILHCQLGGFPHRGANGVTDRIRRRFGRPDQD